MAKGIILANKVGGMDRCHNCGQEIIEIENDALRLSGCLTCNLWASADGDRWVRLSEEDLRALHQLRHGGAP
jgi:hypothetical protein